MYKLSTFDNEILFIMVQQLQNSCTFAEILGYCNLNV